MISKVNGISIQGNYYASRQNLPLFEDIKINDQINPCRLALTYGINGAGKSTISKAFSSYKNGRDDFEYVELLNNANSMIEQNTIDNKQIRVFDEDYVLAKTKYADSQLGAIVMFGEQVDIDDQISNKEKNKGILEQALDPKKKEYLEFEDINNNKSPEYHSNLIKSKLKSGWAVQNKDIKGASTNSSVTESVFNEIINLKESSVDVNNLRNEYNTKLTEFKTATNSDKIDRLLFPIAEDTEFDAVLKEALNKLIEKPVLSERENRINEIIANYSEELLENSKKAFEDEATTYCPYCLKDISSDEKNNVIAAINNALNGEDSEKHKSELDKLVLNDLDLDDFSKYKMINEDSYTAISEKIDEYNDAVTSINIEIKKKKNNVFVPINKKLPKILPIQKGLNILIEDIEQKRINHNEKISKVSDLKNELLSANKHIARKEVANECDAFQLQKKKKDELKNYIREKNKEIEEIESSITHLQARKGQVDIAADLINKYLSYIFFDKSRITIDVLDEEYVVTSKGRSIKVNQLSEGERNAIALCYFFSEINNMKDEKEIFTDEYLIVLDDPISSFDFDNKIGLFSFIRSMLNELFSKNEHTKILILTHEIESMHNFIKVSEDLKGVINGQIRKHLLSDGQLKTFPAKQGVYTHTIKNIFSYANSDVEDHEYENEIGNMMRKVLEAFGTFNYCSSIEQMTLNDDILQKLPENMREYYRNYMYRLVLHGESHTEEKIKGLPNRDFLSYISPEQKHKTAKDLLVLLYELNPLHVQFNLKDESNIETIKKWKNDYFS